MNDSRTLLGPHGVQAPSTPIHHNLSVAAERYPLKIAISFFGNNLNYKEFSDTVETIAGWLQNEGNIKKGDRVALYMQNSPQWILAYYAVLRSDAIAVPINPMNKSNEVKHYIEDSGAKLIFCADELLGQLKAADVDIHVISVNYSDYLSLDSGYAIPEWLKASTGHNITDHTAWHDVISRREGEKALARESQATADDIAGIFYTSGSTGLPKGCAISHGAYQHNIAGLCTWHWLAAGTNCLATAPMSHVSGLNHGVHIPVYLGGASVILPRWDGKLALDLIRRQKVGHASIAPTAVADLLDQPSFKRSDLKSLPRITAGGSPMPKTTADRLMEKAGTLFIEAYGLTETSATTHLNPIDNPVEGSVGLPFYGIDAVVFDSESKQKLDHNSIGEVAVRGPQLFSYYWNRRQETKDAFTTIDGIAYFRTGDIGYVNEFGYLFILDRSKRMINASGYKVWPAEIERELRKHPGIKDVCVIGTPDAYRGENVKAFIVRHPDVNVQENAIIEWAKERMAAYKYPRSVEFLDEMPTSNVGKTLWKELQDREHQRHQLKTPQ